jgi:hypothetical protein
MSQAIFSQWHIRSIERRNELFLFFSFVAAALEVLLIFASLRIGLVAIMLLHLGALFRFVPPNNATARGSQNSMVASIMARDATDDGALNAALRVS